MNDTRPHVASTGKLDLILQRNPTRRRQIFTYFVPCNTIFPAHDLNNVEKARRFIPRAKTIHLLPE